MGSKGEPSIKTDTTHKIKQLIRLKNPTMPVLTRPIDFLKNGNAIEPEIPTIADALTSPPSTDSLTHW